MLLLAHLGYTAGAVRVGQKFALRRFIDYRLVALMAILPDVIDRPLYVFVIPGAQSGRLLAHTLVFNLVLLAVLMAIRRGLWIYGILPLFHLIMDLQGSSTHQFFWPFLGADLGNVHIPGGLVETAGQSYGDRIGDRIHVILDTYSGAGVRSLLIDGSGLAALVILTLKAGLHKRRRLAQLLVSGEIET